MDDWEKLAKAIRSAGFTAEEASRGLCLIRSSGVTCEEFTQAFRVRGLSVRESYAMLVADGARRIGALRHDAPDQRYEP